jgi:hypothetical protein
MNDLNVYNDMEFKEKFLNTKIYQQLQNDFDVVCFNEKYNYDEVRGTPREWYGSRNRKTIFSAIPFYYIEYLTRHTPLKICDIGCGWNIFKKYIPNIVGLSGEPPNHIYYYGDEYGYVDDKYIQEHQAYFESAFSINALHYVHLTHLRKRVLDIVSMIKPDGRLFLSLNLSRMSEVDSNFNGWSLGDIESWVREQLDNMPFTYEVFEITFLKLKDDAMNGNIRMVIWNKIT